MGEEKEKKGSATVTPEKKKEAGSDGGKDAAAAAPIVLKMDLHCAGCAVKVKKSIKNFPGVESVASDTAANKVTVTGPADAAKLKERIEAKTRKSVEIVPAGNPPKKDGGGEKKAAAGGGGGDKPKDDKGKEKKQASDDKKPKEPAESTVASKIRLHCESCIDRTRRWIYKIKGVKDVAFDAAKDLVRVKGTMDVAALPAYIKEKFNCCVEVVPAATKDDGKKDGKKDDGGDGGKEKGEKKTEGGDEKKEKEKGKKKKEGGDEKKEKEEVKEKKKGESEAAATTAAPAASAATMAPPLMDMRGYMPGYMSPYSYMPAPYDHNAYAVPNPNADYYPPPGYPRMQMMHAPQMFSDENPNSCTIT